MDYFQILLTIHRYQKSDGTKYLMQFINVCQSSLSLFCVWGELHDRNQGMKYHLWFMHNKFKCNRTQKRIDAQTICFSYYMKERQNAILHKIAIRIFNTYRYLSKLSLVFQAFSRIPYVRMWIFIFVKKWNEWTIKQHIWYSK